MKAVRVSRRRRQRYRNMVDKKADGGEVPIQGMRAAGCWYFGRKKGCNRGDACPFVHEQLREKRVCFFFNSVKGCRRGENCPFVHDVKLKGTCPFGRKCTRLGCRLKHFQEAGGSALDERVYALEKGREDIVGYVDGRVDGVKAFVDAQIKSIRDDYEARFETLIRSVYDQLDERFKKVAVKLAVVKKHVKRVECDVDVNSTALGTGHGPCSDYSACMFHADGDYTWTDRCKTEIGFLWDSVRELQALSDPAEGSSDDADVAPAVSAPNEPAPVASAVATPAKPAPADPVANPIGFFVG